MYQVDIMKNYALLGVIDYKTSQLTCNAGEELFREVLYLTVRKRDEGIAFQKVKDTLT